MLDLHTCTILYKSLNYTLLSTQTLSFIFIKVFNRNYFLSKLAAFYLPNIINFASINKHSIDITDKKYQNLSGRVPIY